VSPVGSVEPQGPHLPLTVGIEIPVGIAARVVEKINGLVGLAIFYGAGSLTQSEGDPEIPGTIRVRGSARHVSPYATIRPDVPREPIQPYTSSPHATRAAIHILPSHDALRANPPSGVLSPLFGFQKL
jgi:hypothetical protein